MYREHHQNKGPYRNQGHVAQARTPRSWPGVLEAYRNRLDIPGDVRPVTMREGGTPLIEAEHLSSATGCRVLLKVEGMNPTGSFKDRGMAMAITHAVAEGSRAVICASTGNTAASAAAYATRASMTAAVVVPSGKVAAGKLAQAVAHGGRILQVRGNFDDCLELADKVTAEQPVTLVNSVNPHRLEGQKTAAFEVCDMLGNAPDVHCIPVGNAGNITAYWKGYREYATDGVIPLLPRMFGFQAAGAAPLVLGASVADPDTAATAIRVGNPASWTGAKQAQEESGGLFEAVPDEAILRAQQLLSSREGVFVEPASAASVAGLLATSAEGRLPTGCTVVCTVTGHGLKDPDAALAQVAPTEPIRADPSAVAQALALG